MSKTIICLYGGAGCGKSTVCAGLFYHIKILGYSCEMNREYVKNWIWEQRDIREGDQTYFFAKQSRAERVCIMNKMDFIITDSPLILTHFYGLQYCPMEQKSNTSKIMLEHHHVYCKDNGYKTEHYFLDRPPRESYDEDGRFQTYEEALEYDQKIIDMMDEFGLKYKRFTANEQCVEKILIDLGLIECI